MDTPAQFINNYLADLKNLFDMVSRESFEEFVDTLDHAYQREADIFIFGNGGSGSTASHFACDMNKGVSYGRAKRFRVICLNDNIPALLAYANDISYEDVFVEQLINFLKQSDLVIGISGSGNSENVVRAIDYATKKGAATYGICGFGGGRLKSVANKSMVIRCNDMQKVEDLHFIFLHCVMQCLKKSLDMDP